MGEFLVLQKLSSLWKFFWPRSKKGSENNEKMYFANLENLGHGLLYQEKINERLTKVCLYLSSLLIVSIGIIGFLALREVKPVYFATNQAMQLVAMTPLDQPLQTDQALKSWAAQAMIDIFNLDFVHYKRQVADLRRYFTKEAFISFRKSLKDEGHLKILQQYRAVMHGVCTGPPVITAQGVLDNKMTWELNVPFQLAYETSEKVLSNQKLNIRLRLKRVSTAEYAAGLAITQLIVGHDVKI